MKLKCIVSKKQLNQPELQVFESETLEYMGKQTFHVLVLDSDSDTFLIMVLDNDGWEEFKQEVKEMNNET